MCRRLTLSCCCWAWVVKACLQASDLEVLQIHYDEAGKVHVFSRNRCAAAGPHLLLDMCAAARALSVCSLSSGALQCPTLLGVLRSENMQGKYPDIIAMVPRHLAEGVKSLVIDCEAVAWDKQAQKVLPFQASLC